MFMYVITLFIAGIQYSIMYRFNIHRHTVPQMIQRLTVVSFINSYFQVSGSPASLKKSVSVSLVHRQLLLQRHEISKDPQSVLNPFEADAIPLVC